MIHAVDYVRAADETKIAQHFSAGISARMKLSP